MTTLKERENSALARLHDPWPRLTDWFDTMLPTDLGWRGMHTMRVEQFVKDDVLTVRAELPGMDPDKEIEVTVGDGLLTIEAEREERKEEEHRSEFFYGRFVRTVSLPAQADETAVTATYKDGILEVSVPVTPAAEPAGTKVPVTRAS